MEKKRQIRVLLADDHTMFREGLARLLTTYGGLDVVGDTPSSESAVELARQTLPDVVIMEIQKPFAKGKEILDGIRAISPTPKVVVVTMFEDPGLVREALKLGASGYVLKSASATQLLGAVRAAVSAPEGGNVVVGMPLAMLEESDGGSEGILSAREMEILLLVSRGLSNRQIAARVHLAEGTIKRHLANTYDKMKVGSRSEAVRKALQEDWITITEIIDEEDAKEDT